MPYLYMIYMIKTDDVSIDGSVATNVGGGVFERASARIPIRRRPARFGACGRRLHRSRARSRRRVSRFIALR